MPIPNDQLDQLVPGVPYVIVFRTEDGVPISKEINIFRELSPSGNPVFRPSVGPETVHYPAAPIAQHSFYNLSELGVEGGVPETPTALIMHPLVRNHPLVQTFLANQIPPPVGGSRYRRRHSTHHKRRSTHKKRSKKNKKTRRK
jgi:hypothetical protein